jgi:glycosyltransferase involved in cell wall biosynthesis
MSIKLTIITATYNRGHVIKKCLDSVLAQKFKDIEHLIIDNMSSDNTQEIVEEYIKNADYKVRYIREPDKGIYNAFNKGIRLAEGEWIHFLNSDDEYYDTELLFNIFSEDVDSYDLLACGIFFNYQTNQIYSQPHYDNELKEFKFPHTGTILKRNFLINNGFYNEELKIASDRVFNWQFYDKAKYKIFNSPLVLMSTSGVSSTFTFSYIIERIKVYWLFGKFSTFYKINITINEVINLIQVIIIKIVNKLKNAYK